jgi:hypothetical protein
LERSIAQGGVSDRTPGQFDLAVARRTDDADIRRLLRECATEGWIRLSLEREPDAFAAAAVMGPHHHYIVARTERSGQAIGLCEWSARETFIDGEVRLLPYLGALRIAASDRHRIRILRQGFDAVRRLPRPRGATPYALTMIGAENRAALRLLGRNLRGMPTYRRVEPFATFALRPAHARRSIDVERAGANDLAAIAVCLERTYRQFQYAPVWHASDLTDPRRCPGLRPEDFLIVRSGPGIAACVALWDQSAFKQTIVRGYPGWLGQLRPAVNVAAPFLRMPCLPAVGQRLRQIYLSHLAVEGNDENLFRCIVTVALSEARRRGFALALLGLSPRHPLAAVLSGSWRHREYRALLHLVHWADGAAAVEQISPRIPHIEIAVL